MMIAQLIVFIIILAIQLVEVVTLLLLIFDTGNHGSYFTVALMIALLGCSGIFFGLWCSCICTEFMEANLLLTGISQPMIVLSSMLWPHEGMPWYLQYVSLCMPSTLPSISVRNIIEKGFSITHPTVLLGFFVLIVWVVMGAFLGFRTLEKKKYSRNS